MTSFTEKIRELAQVPRDAKPKMVRVPWGDSESYYTKREEEYKGMNKYWAEYRRSSIVRQSLNLLGYFAIHSGFRISAVGGSKRYNTKISKYLNDLSRRVHLEDAIFIGVIGKMIWGRFGFEIVRNGDNEIVHLLPLFPGENLIPKFDENNILKGFTFKMGGGRKIEYEPEEVLFFVETSLDHKMKGLSRIEPILTPCEIKRRLYQDLKEASKRLWSPIGIFQLDTSREKDPDKKEEALREFKNQMEPGKPIVTNASVSGQFLSAMPDVERIVRAIDKVDEEIMGNFGIPKALLSREKTMNRATLEYSLVALYQSQIEGIQRYVGREIEQQLLEMVKDDVVGSNGSTITCELVWNPRNSLEMDRQFGPAITLYSLGLIDAEYLYDMLSLDKNRMPEYIKKAEEEYEGGVRYSPDVLRASLTEASRNEEAKVREAISKVVKDTSEENAI